mmetsp:Transcript_14531/g.21884  ORF Transcript_14531/g.21884 Transcript_14531/m.21884 type:complete len:237 (-) Transcript_14531:3995-4705(-)
MLADLSRCGEVLREDDCERGVLCVGLSVLILFTNASNCLAASLALTLSATGALAKPSKTCCFSSPESLHSVVFSMLLIEPFASSHAVRDKFLCFDRDECGDIGGRPDGLEVVALGSAIASVLGFNACFPPISEESCTTCCSSTLVRLAIPGVDLLSVFSFGTPTEEIFLEFCVACVPPLDCLEGDSSLPPLRAPIPPYGVTPGLCWLFFCEFDKRLLRVGETLIFSLAAALASLFT